MYDWGLFYLVIKLFLEKRLLKCWGYSRESWGIGKGEEGREGT